MRRWPVVILVALAALTIQGCSSDKDEVAPPVNAPIDNNAPAARNAPPAPIDPRALPPGSKRRKLPSQG